MKNKLTKERIVIFTVFILFVVVALGAIVLVIFQNEREDENNTTANSSSYLSTSFENETNPPDGEIREETFTAEYGEEVTLKTQKVFSGKDGWGSYTNKFIVFIDGKQIEQYHSDNDSVSIEGIYNQDGVTAYSIGGSIFCKSVSDDCFVWIGENQHYEEIKPFLLYLLKKGDLINCDALFEHNETKAIELIKEYAVGNFSNSEFEDEDELQKRLNQETAVSIIERFGIK